MLILFTLILATALVFVATKFLLLKRELRQLSVRMAKLHKQPTNARLIISSQDADIVRLAVEVNRLYDSLDEQRAVHIGAMDEMRQNMANISHDLRTPLTSILGYIKLLKDGADDEDQRSHYLSVAYAKANSLNSLINSLFELANLQAGNYQIELERLDANELLSEEVAAFYGQLTANGEQPNIKLSSNPLYIIADKQGVSRIFTNLLQNMVKHGRGEFAITSKAEDGKAVFTFANHTDIEIEDVQQLFLRSFTADHVRSGENAGLGLSIVQEFCRHTGGEVSCNLHQQRLIISVCWKLSI